jgi:hypothetical protein
MHVAKAQFTPTIVGTFPSILSETSGLEVNDSLTLWTHNDSGGEDRIYLVNHNAQILDSFDIINANNKDWEDLAKDDATGNIFIGDFGNNNQSRDDLRIYIVNPDTLTNNNHQLITETISFSYPDQSSFPPSSNNKNFDCESMFFYNDSLYLISKNTSNIGTGYAKLYRLPSIAGSYTAELMDSFYFHEPITAADISPDGNTLIVTGYLSLFIFKNYSGSNFFNGTLIKKTYTIVSQKEAIVFANDSTIYISDEEGFGTGMKLYTSTFNSIIYSGLDKSIAGKFFFVYPNPCSEKFFIQNLNYTTTGSIINIKNILGNIVKSYSIEDIKNGIDISEFKSGTYLLELDLANEKTYLLKIIIY